MAGAREVRVLGGSSPKKVERWRVAVPLSATATAARGEVDLVTDNAAKEAFSSRQQPNIAMQLFFQVVSFQDWGPLKRPPSV